MTMQLQPADFNGKELTLKLNRDGKLGGFDSASGKMSSFVMAIEIFLGWQGHLCTLFNRICSLRWIGDKFFICYYELLHLNLFLVG